MAAKKASPVDPHSRQAKKTRLIEALAHFLVDDQAEKSIKLQMGNTFAKEWAAVRAASPVHGYPTFEEAVSELTELLG